VEASVKLIGASVKLVDASVKLIGASVKLMDASVKLIGASVKLVNASVKLIGAPIKLVVAPIKLMGAPVKLTHVRMKFIHAPLKLIHPRMARMGTPSSSFTHPSRSFARASVGCARRVGSHDARSRMSANHMSGGRGSGGEAHTRIPPFFFARYRASSARRRRVSIARW
jgi:hypothetical protein